MLLFLLDRVSHMTTPHRLIVASPDTPPNHAIADLCAKHGYECMLVPGDPRDVLGRFCHVARQVGETSLTRITMPAPPPPVLHALTQPPSTTIVRVLGDSPLTDPTIIDAMLAQHSGWDHTGIALEWGDGLEIDVLRQVTLYVANDEASLPSDRENVVPYVWRQPERFRTHVYPCPWDCSWLRCSIDTPEDLAIIERLLDRCLWRYGPGFGWRHGPGFGWRDIAYLAGQYPDIKEYMLSRPHNPAYAEQVAQEQGEPVQSWAQLRYRSQP